MEFSEHTKCMSCKKPFDVGDNIIVCSVCGAYYHSGCWASNGQNHCKNPECASNIEKEVAIQTQEGTKEAGLSAVGNPICPICSMPIENMINATYCPKCRSYHHSYCFNRKCATDRSYAGGVVLKTKQTTKDDGIDEPSAEGNPKCSVCGHTIEEMSRATYCPKCNDYHHKECAMTAPCAEKAVFVSKATKRNKPSKSAPAKTQEHSNNSIAVLCMVFGIIALMMALSCESPAFVVCFPAAIVFACLERAMKNKFIYGMDREVNGFTRAGSITATIAVPLSIVSTIKTIASLFLIIIRYGPEIFEALDLDSLF